MAAGDRWIDLLDPSLEELERALPPAVHERAKEQLTAPRKHRHIDDPRPTLKTYGDYVFGIFLVAVAVKDEDEVYFQEIDIVATRDLLVTIRKTPPNGRPPYDPAPAQLACRETDSIGMIVYHLVDDLAERFLDLVDDLNEEIDQLEDQVEDWDNERVRARLSSLRHDLLHVRRTLAPTRDAIREVIDNRVEFEGDEVFTHDVEVSFGTAYDKLLRATDNLELSRDLVASVRDYHVAKVANDQNDVMKRLTVIAALVLVPTFIVGVYGQNFDNMPELGWHLGYLGWSWGLIVGITIIQVIWFKRKKWL